MDTTQIILVSVALVSACALQGAVGFGAGLFAIPLMVWAGVDLPSAIMITMGGDRGANGVEYLPVPRPCRCA